MQRQQITDVLFRIGLYRGTPAQCPHDLVNCSIDYDGQFVRRYATEINDEHELAEWLLDECEGPWTMRMARPLYQRKVYLCFARKADAVMFRCLSCEVT